MDSSMYNMRKTNDKDSGNTSYLSGKLTQSHRQGSISIV